MVGENTEVNTTGFENYAMYLLRPTNFETGELELNIIYEKYQEKDNFVLNNAPSDAKWIHITDKIEEIKPLSMWKLDDATWINYKLLTLLEDNNSTATI